jgi:hypothetical protein
MTMAMAISRTSLPQTSSKINIDYFGFRDRIRRIFTFQQGQKENC